MYISAMIADISGWHQQIEIHLWAEHECARGRESRTRKFTREALFQVSSS